MQLPVNAPKCAHHNNHRDGAMNVMHRDEEDRYIVKWVESLSDPRVTHEIRSIWISYLSQADKSCGHKVRFSSHSEDENSWKHIKLQYAEGLIQENARVGAINCTLLSTIMLNLY